MAILSINNKKNNRTKLYAVKNIIKHYLIEGTEGPFRTRNAVIVLKNSEGIFQKEINPDAPLIATNTGNGYYFEIQIILRNAAIFPEITLPKFEANFRLLPGFIQSFKIKSQVISVANSLLVSDEFFVTNSRIKQSLFNRFGQDYFNTEFGANLKFLNNPFQIKKIAKNSVELLTFIFNINPCPTDAYIQITAKMFDGSQKILPYEIINNIKENQVVEINCNFDKISKLFSTQEIERYTVQLFEYQDNQTTYELSEKKTYLIDHYANINQQKQLIFKNTMGVWETIAFRGSNWQIKEVAEQHITNFSNLKKSYSIEIQTKYLFKTGNLELGELQLIDEELLTSQEVYLIEGGQYIRLFSENKQIQNLHSSNAFENITLEYSIAECEIY